MMPTLCYLILYIQKATLQQKITCFSSVCNIPHCSSSHNVLIDKKIHFSKCFILYYKALVMAEAALRVTMKYCTLFPTNL